MTDRVKGRPGRREQKALATRNRMLDAAEELFIRDGYAATTITAIADAGDVAVQTVYAVFGTKRAILAELLEVRTTGDDDDVPVRARADWRAMEAETDPREQLAGLASIATGIAARIADLYEVMAGAAGSDPEIAAMYQDRQQARYGDQRHLAESMARRNALRRGLSAAHATDIMWTLASPRTYHALVGQRGWQPAEYETWLADVLSHACVMPADSAE